jgi:hypothetical protein
MALWALAEIRRARCLVALNLLDIMGFVPGNTTQWQARSAVPLHVLPIICG